MPRIFHILTWFYVVLLTLLLWLPDPRTYFRTELSDEGPAGYAHIITFALLAFLIEIDRERKSRFFWTTLLIGYVFLTEIVQEMLPTFRCFDIADIIQDLAGLMLGLYFADIAKPMVRRFLNRSSAIS